MQTVRRQFSRKNAASTGEGGNRCGPRGEEELPAIRATEIVRRSRSRNINTIERRADTSIPSAVRVSALGKSKM